MTEFERQQIIELVKKEVIPAIGCTEPIAVALCVAKAAETLGEKPEKIEVLLSANILKNAMGVGIPGTGMIGLPIAIALGAIVGKSESSGQKGKPLPSSNESDNPYYARMRKEGKKSNEEERILGIAKLLFSQTDHFAYSNTSSYHKTRLNDHHANIV